MSQYKEISTLQYMGSKSRILPYICDPIVKNNAITRVIDLFAGTGSVGYALKETKNIVSNDIEYYAYIINKAILNGCVFAKEDEEAFNRKVQDIYTEVSSKVLDCIEEENRFFNSEVDYKAYKTFCDNTPSVFTHPQEDMRFSSLEKLVKKVTPGAPSQKDVPCLMFNEWEPYAYKMATAPFRGIPSEEDINVALEQVTRIVMPIINDIYKTRCPNCGAEFPFDGLFFDRDPQEFFHPTHHERLGENGENVIFRGRYRCNCGCKEKNYDDFDESVRLHVESLEDDFPRVELIENSRINFTAPYFTQYENMFSKRQRIALMSLKNAIQTLPETTRAFFEDTFV